MLSEQKQTIGKLQRYAASAAPPPSSPSFYKVLFDTEARRHKQTKLQAAAIIHEQTAEIERLMIEVERQDDRLAKYRRQAASERPEIRKAAEAQQKVVLPAVRSER